MLGTAIRCSIQYCIIASRLADPRVLSRPVYPARGHGPKLNCDKPRTSWTVASLRPRNRYTQAKCQCMASQRQSGQPNTSELLAILNFINDSTKWVVTLTAGGVLAWHHDIYVSWCLVGSVVAVFVCKVLSSLNTQKTEESLHFIVHTFVQRCCLYLQALKKAINIQRPAYARKQDPGMPSSHASSLAYLAVYLAVAWQPAQSALASSGLVLAALLVSC